MGRPYRFVEECGSTQRLLDPDDAEGATVATDLQTQGRGGLGRAGEAPPGRGQARTPVGDPAGTGAPLLRSTPPAAADGSLAGALARRRRRGRRGAAGADGGPGGAWPSQRRPDRGT